jgi:hypothetical protein
MPFREELNFFFLYLQNYLKDNHGIHVERGDHKILTQPLMEKIRNQITKCDFVIADVTGGNPNVFYELGLAHSSKKPVIFITQDSPKDAPVDIRPYEFIVYSLGEHSKILDSLDNAVSALFSDQHRDLFDEAKDILGEFNRDNGSSYQAAPEEDFHSRLLRGGGAEAIKSSSGGAQRKRMLLAKIIKDTSEVAIMEKITSWQK